MDLFNFHINVNPTFWILLTLLAIATGVSIIGISTKNQTVARIGLVTVVLIILGFIF